MELEQGPERKTEFLYEQAVFHDCFREGLGHDTHPTLENNENSS